MIDVIETIAIVLSALFVGIQLYLQRAAVLASSLFALNQRWNSRELLSSRRDVCRRGLEETEIPTSLPDAWITIALFFEEIGSLTLKRSLDRQIIWDIYSWDIEHFYSLLEPEITEKRKLKGDTSFFERFEQLYDLMQEISEKRNVPRHGGSEEGLKKFCEEHYQVANASLNDPPPPAQRISNPKLD